MIFIQVKKENIKEALLETARQEFLKKGFKGASLRKIVKNSGTNLGNFYNYFTNKEALFIHLIEEEYANFMKLMLNHQEIDVPDYLLRTTDIKIWKDMIYHIINEMMPNLTNNFVLLVECSSGTKYEGIKERIVLSLSEHFSEHLKSMNTDDDEDFAYVIALQLLNGFIYIIKTNDDTNTRKKLLCEYLLFFFVGSMGIINNYDRR